MMNVFKPSAKAIAAGANPHSRIMYMNEHYIHIAPTRAGYRFMQGDAFEWKPNLKKPDSLWKKETTVDPKLIVDSDLISVYNKKTYKKELDALGII